MQKTPKRVEVLVLREREAKRLEQIVKKLHDAIARVERLAAGRFEATIAPRQHSPRRRS